MLSVNCLLFRKDNYFRSFVKCLSAKYFVKPCGPTAMLLSNVPTSGFSAWLSILCFYLRLAFILVTWVLHYCKRSGFSLHLSAFFKCTVIHFWTFLFFSGWGVSRARATFGVLAENSVVLWRIRWGSCVNLVELMMQCTPPASKRLVSVCLFRASSPWFFSTDTPASFHKVKTDSDRYTGMTSSCPVYGSETHIKPH